MTVSPHPPRRLWLLRHAQAEPARAGSPDAGRRLTAEGRRQAHAAALRVAAAVTRIDELLVSPATRAQETASPVVAALAVTAPDAPQALRIEPALYPGDQDSLLRTLQACRDGSRSVLIIAHNPGLSALASWLHGAAGIELGTAGLCRIDLGDTPWLDIGPASVTQFEQLR